jgi:hypothetical protein
VALREAKKAGLIAGRNPKSEDLELAISQWNTDRLMLDDSNDDRVAALVEDAEQRIAAIDWDPILALPKETRRSLHTSISASLASHWGVMQ